MMCGVKNRIWTILKWHHGATVVVLIFIVNTEEGGDTSGSRANVAMLLLPSSR